MKQLCATAALVVLAGCAGQSAAGEQATPVRFLCDRGISIGIAFEGGRAVLEGPNGSVAMTSQPAASGFLYAGGGQSIRGKGHELIWINAGGTSVNCRDQKWAMQQPQVEPPAPPLLNSHWTLVSFQSSDDSIGTVVPPRVERYTLAFEADGRLAMQLDCNRGMGRWQVTSRSFEGGALELLGGAMTQAACPPDSIDGQIARDLSRVRSYIIRGNRLFLSLEADSGVYEFRRS
jgi:para-nitrobenzyl esterase